MARAKRWTGDSPAYPVRSRLAQPRRFTLARRCNRRPQQLIQRWQIRRTVAQSGSCAEAWKKSVALSMLHHGQQTRRPIREAGDSRRVLLLLPSIFAPLLHSDCDISNQRPQSSGRAPGARAATRGQDHGSLILLACASRCSGRIAVAAECRGVPDALILTRHDVLPRVLSVHPPFAQTHFEAPHIDAAMTAVFQYLRLSAATDRCRWEGRDGSVLCL